LKTENTFRFSLQFPDKTPEQIRVGELLERLGYKKSRFIVMAVDEYIQKHPELMEPNSPIHIQISRTGLTRDEIRVILEEMLNERKVSADRFETTQQGLSETSADSMEDMLSGLDEFLK